MKTTSRPREIGGSFSSRRGHGAQLSISDPNHHITEAIGDMYGDDDYGARDSRPLSFVTSSLGESSEVGNTYFEPPTRSTSRTGVSRPLQSPNGSISPKSHTLSTMQPSQRNNPYEHGPLSPPISLRENSFGSSDTANSQFPLNDVDYESNPAAVAQELSNLQALRRMSMDVGNTSDPDLPSFQGVPLMPSVAPTGGDDEDDPSRLFWVPARVHPELAPMEFKTFLEKRVQTIKRRSGEQSSLSPDGPERTGSVGGLRRKKSMLSRQIDNSYGRGAVGYTDGAEKLERKKSQSRQRAPDLKIADLQELDELVRDPSKAMQKLSLESNLRLDSGVEDASGEDMPILPAVPGIRLQRSRHTTYRRGSLRKGERGRFSKRAGARGNDVEGEDLPISPISPGSDPPLRRTPSEPITENFSRPGRVGRRGANVQQNITVPTISHELSFDEGIDETEADFNSNEPPSLDIPQTEKLQGALPPRKSSFVRVETPVPQIIETPPSSEPQPEESGLTKNFQFPERSSSQSAPPVAHQPAENGFQQPAQHEDPSFRSNKRPITGRQTPSTPQGTSRVSPGQTLNEMAQQPSPLLSNSGRTDSLTFIPTINEDRKPDKKQRKDDLESGSKKSTWGGWFKNSDEKERKERRKEEEIRKGKSRNALDKSHDSARLDVLQHSIDTAVQRGRESLLLDREAIDHKLSDERKKESGRKSGGEGKKEKDGIFAHLNLFGSKKKNDREAGGKKANSLRALSPDPGYRHLRPDIDYNWTRFSILEERAIYRMAHIKLANPRRALYSQVLLSNFMYSYLAKVQQMHPHVQIPQSAQQKKQQEMERKQKEQEQQRLIEQQHQHQQQHQQHQQQGGDQYRYDYHQGISEYADHQQQSLAQSTEGVSYVDDSQIYDYDHQENEPSRQQGSDRPKSRASQHTGENGYAAQNQYGRQGHGYYPYGTTDHGSQRDDGEESDMW